MAQKLYKIHVEPLTVWESKNVVKNEQKTMRGCVKGTQEPTERYPKCLKLELYDQGGNKRVFYYNTDYKINKYPLVYNDINKWINLKTCERIGKYPHMEESPIIYVDALPSSSGSIAPHSLSVGCA